MSDGCTLACSLDRRPTWAGVCRRVRFHEHACAGRAGRKGTQYENGLATTRDPAERYQLRHALAQPTPDDYASTAGLLPTSEQVCSVLRPAVCRHPRLHGSCHTGLRPFVYAFCWC